MKNISFSSKDKYIIAEFIYSYSQDVLIKSDAIDLVKVLFRHELLFNINSWIKDIEAQDDKVASRLIYLIEENVSKEQIKEIMQEYYDIKI